MLLAGRREETSTVQAAEIEKKIDDKPVLAVKLKFKKQDLRKGSRPPERKGEPLKVKSCFNCGGDNMSQPSKIIAKTNVDISQSQDHYLTILTV